MHVPPADDARDGWAGLMLQRRRTLDDAVAALNRTERRTGKTVISVRP